ncbi:MAG: hypothetical protein E7466_03635 [Ruminococcaceae bacterium]|nr:hypothetical protein [Oscillospiraceae bacterium]
MIVLSMTATFGKLEHQTLHLEPGLNIIDAPNEWGKSTWCAFLMTMLYGLDTRERTTKTTLAEKERYAPWSGSLMSGRLELLWQGRHITIERWSKGRTPMGEFRAYETDSGLPVPELTAANCGQTLLGVERSVYARGGFLRSAEMPVTLNEELRSRLNALVTTGDDSGTAEALGEKLRELKNRCRYHRSGLIPQAESRRAELENQLQEHQRLSVQLKEIERRIGQLEQERQNAEEDGHQAMEQALHAELTAQERCQALERQWEELSKGEPAQRTKNPMRPVWLTLGVALLAAGTGLTMFGWLWALLLLPVGALSLVAGWMSKPKQINTEASAAELQAQLEEARQIYRNTRMRVRSLQFRQPEEAFQQRQRQLHMQLGQCQGQLQSIGDPALIHRELERVNGRLARLELMECAITMAQQALAEAHNELQRRFAPGIRENAQRILSRLTGGRYDRLLLGEDLSLEAGATGEDTLRSPQWRSEGTADQIYLSLRLAVAAELTPEAPLVLDDALIRFDDARLTAALDVLREMSEQKQVILFSCRNISDSLRQEDI